MPTANRSGGGADPEGSEESFGFRLGLLLFIFGSVLLAAFEWIEHVGGPRWKLWTVVGLSVAGGAGVAAVLIALDRFVPHRVSTYVISTSTATGLALILRALLGPGFWLVIVLAGTAGFVATLAIMARRAARRSGESRGEAPGTRQ